MTVACGIPLHLHCGRPEHLANVMIKQPCPMQIWFAGPLGIYGREDLFLLTFSQLGPVLTEFGIGGIGC